VLILWRAPRVGYAAIHCQARPQSQRRPPRSSRVRVRCLVEDDTCCPHRRRPLRSSTIVPPSFLHDGASHPPNINLVVAVADSGGDERVSGVDHEDGDDSPTTDGVDLGVAVVVQGLDLSPTGLDLGSVFF
jgi:hypothetical protein